MISRLTIKLILASFLIISISCSSSKTLSTDTSETESTEENSEETVEEIPSLEGWHTWSSTDTEYKGIDLDLAYEQYLNSREPKKKVLVAIIDSGVDRFHEDLSDIIWVNKDETPLNGIDDDNNGYVDDIYGWNFIGGKDSSHVENDSYELTRIYFEMNERFEGLNPDSISESDKEDYEYYLALRKDHESNKEELKTIYDQLNQIVLAANFAQSILNIPSIDAAQDMDLSLKDDDTEAVKNAKQVLQFFVGQGITDEVLEFEYNMIENQLNSLDPANDTRYIVGDDYDDLTVTNYGNNDVVGPFADHGTHVAGIVGAIRNNDIGMNGIADNIEIMILRTVPNGDERDKDVANAIRYAVQNGANVINMSFGKSFSPQKEYVDDAVRYADSSGVLMIHGAGNDGYDVDVKKNYPNKYYADSTGYAMNWITVGASTPAKELNIAADFSNYGKNNVDVFAPGVSIYSTVPNNEYEFLNGTSMAAPVVTGLAALIMSYYPELTSEQVKRIIFDSAEPLFDEIQKPGSQIEYVPFSSLSASGGIVNALRAVQLAEQMTNQE